jgi:Uma2 family endonuclease
MGMPAALRPRHSEWTAELVRQLPDDGNRYEVVDGELLVSPAPSRYHQRAVLLLWRLLEDFLRTHEIGVALAAPCDVEFAPSRMVQPDVYCVPLVNGRIAERFVPADGLLLAAEVLSPFTARFDRHTKRHLYQLERVPEYWIVDVNARLIERWHPDDERPQICDEIIEWRIAGHAPTLTIDLGEYFRGLFEIFENPSEPE